MLGLREQRREFLVVNLNQIKNEAARGEGENLSALAAFYGCTAPGASTEFNRICKEEYAHIFSPSEESEIDDRIESGVRSICL
jgi:hypothetical protein